ncbi:antitoxin [Nocardioides alkalitolerans]|uniref:antitoxin n=1 Tax=Nocardioides alkalitolerans TaxID=281714 RepID=UPI0003F77844|nr:antitoxin [Nocardioides alkalitolerans]
MGFADKLKGAVEQARTKAGPKLADAVDKHGDKVTGGIEKAGAFADKKTKGKYSDKIAKGTTKAREGIEKLDKKNGPDQPGGTGTGPLR